MLKEEKKGSGTFQVEYTHNGKVFYTSTREPKLPLWVSQAFHPEALDVRLIEAVRWV